MYQKVDYDKLQFGELVQVPRTCVAAWAKNWSGWVFAPAVVIDKPQAAKASKKQDNNHVRLKVMLPKTSNDNRYDIVHLTFPAHMVFKSNRDEIARRVLEENNIKTKQQFDVAMTTWTGADWIRFIYDNGFIEFKD